MNAKQRWNKAHYQQINVALDKGLAAQFKAQCAAKGASMAGEIARMIGGSLTAQPEEKPRAKPAGQRFGTRLGRRKGIQKIIAQLGEIMAAEEDYGFNMPEQLVESSREGVDEAIGALASAIEELGCIDIYPPPPPRRKASPAAVGKRGGGRD